MVYQLCSSFEIRFLIRPPEQGEGRLSRGFEVQRLKALEFFRCQAQDLLAIGTLQLEKLSRPLNLSKSVWSP